LSAPGSSRRFPAIGGHLRNHRETRSSGRVVVERVIDAVVPELLVTVDASGVDAEQYSDAMLGPPGDLGRRNASIQPQRHPVVPQVIGPPGQRRVHLDRSERPLARLLPDAAITAFAQHGTPCTARPFRGGTKAVDVRAEQLDQLRPASEGTAAGRAPAAARSALVTFRRAARPPPGQLGQAPTAPPRASASKLRGSICDGWLGGHGPSQVIRGV
jgi:hypothetical protein